MNPWNDIYDIYRHKLDGPISITSNLSLSISHWHKSYYVCGKRYNNFIEYIQAVIEFRKLNSSKDKI